ncbi:hypothetical protein PUN28_005353 [Cardiocondyla obscurior]|uniref:Uncharacterized protein n=1 Tax=Cardiocondyla obscurior TaxID=286306 RepID=A0AAW2GJE7_9HYME
MFDLAFELRRNFHRKSPPSQRDRHRRSAEEAEETRRGRRARAVGGNKGFGGREEGGGLIIPCNDDPGPRPTCRADGIDCFRELTSGAHALQVQTNFLASNPPDIPVRNGSSLK